MTPEDRAAALARRNEWRPIPKSAMNVGDYYCEVVIAELIAQADALEAALVVADTNLTRVEAENARLRATLYRVEGALLFIVKAARRESTDEGASAFRRAAGQLRAALLAVETDENEETP